MQESYDIKNFAIAGALIVAVLYIICRVAFAIAPDIMLEFNKSLFHGLAIQSTAVSLSAARFVVGLIASLIAGAVIGAVMALVCRYVCCKSK